MALPACAAMPIDSWPIDSWPIDSWLIDSWSETTVRQPMTRILSGSIWHTGDWAAHKILTLSDPTPTLHTANPSHEAEMRETCPAVPARVRVDSQ